jgi:hypothetical protein
MVQFFFNPFAKHDRTPIEFAVAPLDSAPRHPTTIAQDRAYLSKNGSPVATEKDAEEGKSLNKSASDSLSDTDSDPPLTIELLKASIEGESQASGHDVMYDRM